MSIYFGQMSFYTVEENILQRHATSVEITGQKCAFLTLITTHTVYVHRVALDPG